MATSNPFEAIQESIAEIKLQNDQLIAIVTGIKSTDHNKPDREYLNIEELMEYLPSKPKRATIYQWTHKGRLPFHKQNNKGLIFRREEIDAWIELGMKQGSKNEDAV